jgi:hypothetical protein
VTVNKTGLDQLLVVQVGLWRLQIMAGFRDMEVLPCYDVGNKSRLDLQHSLTFAVFCQQHAQILRLFFEVN